MRALLDKLTKLKRGQIIILALIFLVAVIILSTAIFSRTVGFLFFGAKSLEDEQAIQNAEAGVDYAIRQLNKTAGNWTGTTSQIALGTTGTFTVIIQPKGPPTATALLKTIIATGYVPDASDPRAKQTIKVDAFVSSQQSVSFRYAVQIGTGGLTMANSSQITGANGAQATVYSNGNITGSGSSTINGDAWAVGTISEPAPLVTGTKHPGASPQPMPDITQLVGDSKAAAEAGGIVNCAYTPALCTISTSQDFGPRKYINGNLTINNNAVVTMKGPVWVAKGGVVGGNFSMEQGGTTVKLDASYGSAGVALIVDGTVSLTQGGNFQPTTATPPGYVLVVSSSTAPQAVAISQSGATAVFYALDGGAELSQTANVSSLAANAVSMSQNSQLTYKSGLASAQFTTGPGGSWQIKRGTYRFTRNP